ncbi:hypothetical protein [Neomoorella mulderi]|uniref:Uncharacterized protein n=1 Tax=Moorella mulderi DSM 14980 TaxID=1122241 RepID=A0A151AVL2_9FIRM|nr:hypothetical protein [Moorella mulderi]KYH31602.1 hypothetical protein MOMUL_21580 [Moorella mulderi DSM 14980]
MPEYRDRLDKLLAGLPGKVPPPLAGWHFTAAMRHRVQNRVAFLPVPEVTARSSRQRWVKWPLAGAVALVLAFLFLAWWQWPVTSPGPPAEFKVKPLQYRVVSFNGPEPEALVSIGQVEGSNQLLASISKRREPVGWQLIYTQPLNAYLVLPLQVMRSDTSRGALILITYQEPWGPEYHYLILEFDGEKVIPYQEQDIVTLTGR